MEIKGIDVSSYQGDINWKTVADYGMDFAILRITEKGNVTDSKFERNYKGCVDNAIPVGVYKYSYARTVTEAKAEADAVLKVLNGRKLDFPIFYDLEWKEQRPLGKTAIEKIAKVFLSKIKKAGYLYGLYSNVDWYNNVFTENLRKYDCWVASYPYEEDDNGWLQERLRPSAGVGWQYSRKATIPGINTKVDRDVFYKDYRDKEGAGVSYTANDAINKVLEIAKAEVGYLEKASNSQLDSKTSNAGRANYTKYWRDVYPSYQGQPWCAAFVSWVLMQAFGQAAAKKLLKHWPYVYCPTLGNLFTRYANPEVGDIVIFWRGGEFAHTGIVTKVSGDYFETIEGNTSGASGIIANGGGVCAKSYYNSQLPGTKFCRIDWAYAASVMKGTEGKEESSGGAYMFTVNTVKNGDSGNHVLLVQEILKARGFKGKDGKELTLDKQCGANTVYAIKQYQKQREAADPGSCGGVDGIAGEKTLRDMIAL